MAAACIARGSLLLPPARPEARGSLRVVARAEDAGRHQGLGPSTSGRHCLSCGQELELLSCAAQGPAASSGRPPLLFVHGALHGAWCYAEHWLPYFAARGYDAHAVSLRGHGSSSQVEGATGSFSDHVDDLASVVGSLQRPPILVAHSMGGILAQRYLLELAQRADRPPLAGVAFLASPGISAALGPSAAWLRQLDGPGHAMQVVWWMCAMPKERRGLVRSLFFSQDLPEAAFARFHARLRAQAPVLPFTAAELREFEASAAAEAGGLQRRAGVPALVLRAGGDRLIMPCQVEALGRMLGVAPVAVPGVAHDLMLDTSWRAAAEVLERFFASAAPAAAS